MKQPNPEQPVNPDAVWRLLGLAIRARRASAGTEAAEQAIRRRTACLVLVAADAAENTQDQIMSQCRRAGIPCHLFGSKVEMGHWTGHEERAVVTITDPGFAGQLIKLISTLERQAGISRHATE